MAVVHLVLLVLAIVSEGLCVKVFHYRDVCQAFDFRWKCAYSGDGFYTSTSTNSRIQRIVFDRLHNVILAVHNLPKLEMISVLEMTDNNHDNACTHILGGPVVVQRGWEKPLLCRDGMVCNNLLL